MTTSHRILLIGCGKMGGALLDGWRHIPALDVVIIDPASPLAHYSSVDAVSGSFSCIVLAVKPQVMRETLLQIKPFISPHCLVLSIAAGKTLSFFADNLEKDCPIVRAMPNTPAAIGYGMSVLCANPFVTAQQKDLAHTLLSSVGLVEWIDEESLMDAVTAVSGSGPAYVFHLIESLAEAGISAGLSKDLSMTLARQTVIGAGALAAHTPDIDVATLRKNVTSPGGTTEAALKILMDDKNGMTALMTEAIAAAKKRSKELS